MTHSLSALEVDHILQSKKCEFLGALTDVLDSEQYDIVAGILEDALPTMTDRLLGLEDERAGIPTKILCPSCTHMVDVIVHRVRNREKHHAHIKGVYCDANDLPYTVPCRVDCYQYKPKP